MLLQDGDPVHITSQLLSEEHETCVNEPDLEPEQTTTQHLLLEQSRLSELQELYSSQSKLQLPVTGQLNVAERQSE